MDSALSCHSLYNKLQHIRIWRSSQESRAANRIRSIRYPKSRGLGSGIWGGRQGFGFGGSMSASRGGTEANMETTMKIIMDVTIQETHTEARKSSWRRPTTRRRTFAAQLRQTDAQAEYALPHDPQNADRKEIERSQRHSCSVAGISTTEHDDFTASRICDALSHEGRQTRQCSVRMI